MGFFLETLLGGLMTGLLYALIGLGFVLIFKASGVFNFAQGAMVLVAALAMARFSGWAIEATGSMLFGNVIGFVLSVAVMIASSSVPSVNVALSRTMSPVCRLQRNSTSRFSNASYISAACWHT